MSSLKRNPRFHSTPKSGPITGDVAPVPLERKKRHKSAVVLSRSPSFSYCTLTAPVERALTLLHATSFLDEKKQQVFDPDVLRAMRGLFPAGKAYQFDMFANTSIGTPAATFILSTLPISPAVATYAEWASLAALFDEVKLVRAALNFLPNVGSDGQALSAGSSVNQPVSAFLCGVNHDNISSSPASYAAVGRLASSANVIRCIGDKGQSIFTFRAPSGLLWARTVTPAVQDPPAGVLGSFDFASDPTTSLIAASIYYKNTLRTTVMLRNRA
jgi:hypothetical protein